MGQPGDLELIERFKRNDSSAFDALMNRYLDRVMGVAQRYLRDPHEAMDVAQDVFVAAFRMLRTWREEGQFFSWLYRTTLNLCSRKLRSRVRRPPASAAEPEAAASESPEESIRRAEVAEAIETALGTLSPRQREIFLCRHEQGMALAEITQRLGISLGAAKTHLHRALTALRDNLALKKLM